jgi:UDP-N-acetylmuramoylalanine--D-glutamate ligase
MTMAFSVAGQHVVVVGAGRSGVAAAELLVRRGARVTLADASPSIDTAERLRGLGVTVELGPHREDQFLSADLVVLSPGVPPSQEAVQRARQAGVPVIGEIELASRWLSGRVIAITGTKGKSTTTTLAARMLQAVWMRRRAAISATR